MSDADARARPARLLGAELRRTIRYGIVGMSAIGLDFTIYAGLVLAGLWYPLAKALSLVVATAFAYTTHRVWTFRAGAHRTVTLRRYLTVQGSCVAANVVLLAILIERAGLNAIVAQALVVPFIAVASFVVQRNWTFAAATR